MFPFASALSLQSSTFDSLNSGKPPVATNTHMAVSRRWFAMIAISAIPHRFYAAPCNWWCALIRPASLSPSHRTPDKCTAGWEEERIPWHLQNRRPELPLHEDRSRNYTRDGRSNDSICCFHISRKSRLYYV